MNHYYYWFIPLTDKQFKKLQKGLKIRFRFQLNLSKETIEYDKKQHILKAHLVYVSKEKDAELISDMGNYINGFSCAIEKA